MEAAISWLFSSSIHHRVPDGRTSSFTQPLLPIIPSSSSSKLLPPKGTLACPLPKLKSSYRPKPATVGYNVDSWAQHHSIYVTNSRGQRLFVQVWRAHPNLPSALSSSSNSGYPITSFFKSIFSRTPNKQNKEKAIVYIIHGLNDHSNKYTRVAKSWVNKGFIVVAFDAHGHGRSDGYRAYTSSMNNYVQDAKDVILETNRRIFSRNTKKLPKFLLAHSLGGAVSIHLTRSMPSDTFRGLLLTAPAVAVFPKPILKLLAPVLSTLTPFLPVQRLKFDKKNNNKRVPSQRGSFKDLFNKQREECISQIRVDAILNDNDLTNGEDDDIYCPYDDPLVVRSPVRARVGYEVLKSCQQIMSQADTFKLPVFVAHSERDRVTNSRGTIEFHSRIASNDKTVKIYPGNVHDLLADKRDLVMKDMIDWASQRLRNHPS